MRTSEEFEFFRLGPRAQGVREHFERAKWLVQLASDIPEPIGKYRIYLSAVYSARAMVEIMLETAERQELKAYHNTDNKKSRKDFEVTLASILPHYLLIEKIRIHDFHRFGCIPPNPHIKSVFFGGPIKLTAQKGEAIMYIPAEGPQYTFTGQSHVKEQRPLCQDDGRFYDDVSGQYMNLDQILNAFLAQAQSTINNFEGML